MTKYYYIYNMFLRLNTDISTLLVLIIFQEIQYYFIGQYNKIPCRTS